MSNKTGDAKMNVVQLSLNGDGNKKLETLQDAAIAQGKVMTVAHSLKKKGQTYVDADCHMIAREAVGEEYGMTGDELWFKITEIRRTEKAGKQNGNPVSPPEKKTPRIVTNNEAIDKQLRDLAVLQEEIAARQSEILKMVAEQKKLSASPYYKGKHVNVVIGNTGSQGREFRIKARVNNWGHICYCDTLANANKTAERIDNVIEMSINEALNQ